MTKEAEEEREIREARTTADVMARLEGIAEDVQRAVVGIVRREGLGIVIILVDPKGPKDVTAMVGGGNLSVESTKDAVETYARMLRQSGITEADKVPTKGIKQ